MRMNRLLKYLLLFSSILLIIGFSYQYFYLPSTKLANVQGCTPLNFRKEKIENEYYLLWETKEECRGYAKYGSYETDFPYLSLDEFGLTEVKLHKVKLSGIGEGEKYYFVIFSDEIMYGNEENPLELRFD